MSSMQINDIVSLKTNLHKTPTANEPVLKPTEKRVNLPSTIKEYEQDEPLLMENKQRFVLFPIKYHEVYYFAYSRRHVLTR